MALVLGRVHLQDGPAHDLLRGHLVARRGEPRGVGEDLPRELVVGEGEQGRNTRRPDALEHRIGIAHVPGELGELRHRIVAGLGGTILLGRHEDHGNVDDMTELPPDLGGVRALITGGTSGLGFAMSQALAEAGARVVLTGRTEQRVQDAAAAYPYISNRWANEAGGVGDMLVVTPRPGRKAR
jgi:short subunit dehydrogenase